MEIVVFAMGNRQRRDDAAGLYAGELLRKKGFRVIDCGVAPENFLGKAGKGIVLIVDAADIKGDFLLTEEVADIPSVSTHGMSLSLIRDYLKARGVRLIVGCIRPETIDDGEGLSKEARERADKLVEEIVRAYSL